MREILFRGKTISDGRWIVGYYSGPVFCNSDHTIEYTDEFQHLIWSVDPDTVGQFTGLTDKNGKRIFDGDILSFPDTGEDGYEYKEGYDFTNIATVCWNDGRWELEDYGDYNSGVMDDMAASHCDFVAIFSFSEIVGNIHDNPELINEVSE